MTTALTGMLAMALLFVVFGAFALADGKDGCHGDCGACTHDGACAADLDFDTQRRDP